jgi:hypothetical protein
MTEPEWMACTDLAILIKTTAPGRLSRRTLRLFGCGCCRRLWPLLGDERSREAVRISEEFADGRVDPEALQAACVAAAQVYPDFADATPETRAGWSAAKAAWRCAQPLSLQAFSASLHARSALGLDVEKEPQCAIFQDIMGNPFRSVTSKAPCLTPVTSIAQAIYHERAFDRMAELGDSLFLAGCTDACILAHCREPGPHVRGCWVLDLLLGSS